MNEIILKTTEITKKYKRIAAVDKVSMTINRGDIYGLIGRNGAGKTTLMRMITSLNYATSGSLELFNEKTESGLIAARRKIGSIIESPAFYNNLNARQNLEYYRLFRGINDDKAIERVLTMVKLTDTGLKKYKDFSLGMKQRLGLALALLHNPEFLLLDEPSNGLDPIAIVEMRETLKSLATNHGITILISSHILNELSLTATRYGIIHHGHLIKELTNDELHEECKNCILLNVDDIEKAAKIIEKTLKTTKYKIFPNNEIRLYSHLDMASEVNYQLNKNGVRVSYIKESRITLEEYFVSILEGKD